MKASVLSSVWGAFALALAVGTSAGAATLISIQGPVQINSGAGFHQVSGAAQVRPGTSIMVGPGGSAEVLYSDGCRMPAGPGSVVTVAPISPCAQGQEPGYNPYTVGVLGIGAGIGIGCLIWCKGNGENNVVVV